MARILPGRRWAATAHSQAIGDMSAGSAESRRRHASGPRPAARVQAVPCHRRQSVGHAALAL